MPFKCNLQRYTADDAKAMAMATFEALGCDVLCVTRGGDGAALITKDGGFIEHPGFEVDAVDTVGAGDSVGLYEFANPVDP